MTATMERVIKSCGPSKANQLERVWNHPAKALPVTGIFDRIGMDLLLGLKETNEGYIGILVITEYLSKYPYAVPITSKSAEEIARRLFEYISLFGRPKKYSPTRDENFEQSCGPPKQNSRN
jgi:hypothetical protein